MDEFELIRRYFRRDAADDDVLVGIGDDGAVLRPDATRVLTVVADTIVAGVHYPPDTDPADIGYRAVAINLSDIAAMGSRPRWMTLALSGPDFEPGWLEAFAGGMFEAADPSGVRLVGGDTTRGGEYVVTVQVIGESAADGVLTRGGARPGDLVYVTGTPGDAAAGLAILRKGGPDNDDEEALVARFRRPTARLAAGMALAGKASAAIDLSDGLIGDLGKLADASGVAAVVNLETLPVSAAMRAAFAEPAATEFALGGGDDYELCFTAAPGALDAVDSGSTRFTAIGRIEAGSGVRCRRNGEPVDYADSGYRHFS